MIEALAVRNVVGIFDVSHMGRMTVEGKTTRANFWGVSLQTMSHLSKWEMDIDSLICNEEGGIKDYLIGSSSRRL